MTSGRLNIGIVITAAVLFCLDAGPAAASSDFVPGEVIVRYAHDSSPAERTTARRSSEVASTTPLLLPGAQVVEAGPGQSVGETIADLEADPSVLYAEPNYLEQLDAVPNDSFLPQLWGDLNAGQTVNGIAGTAGADISAKEGWDIGRTSPNVLTAVLDSGITADHPDLVNQVWVNPGDSSVNGIDDDGNGLVDDRSGWDFINDDRNPVDGEGHGTHVAGIIGATGNNGFGISGVSWDANLMPLQVCYVQGGCPVSAMVDAIGYADRMGAKVANISIGGKVFTQATRDAIAAADDVLFVTSAGNEANDLPAGQGNNDTVSKYPCMDDQQPGFTKLPNVICVASTDQNDLKSVFSNWGATSVDLAAPGSNIVSTFPTFIYLFTDTFDTSSSPWDYAKIDSGESELPDGWERNTGVGATGRGITDSLSSDYLPSSTATTTMTSGVNLSEREGCRLEYKLRYDTEQPTAGSFTGADIFYVEAANSASGPWTMLDRWAGSSGGVFVNSTSKGSQATLEPFAKHGPVFIRFRLQAGAAPNGEGVSVDDVRMRCAGVSSPSFLQYLNGTSMATPQVSGIASLVRETNPGLSPTEVKAKILGGVDVIPALNAGAGSLTPVVSGGRANLFKTLSSLDRTPPPVPQLFTPSAPIVSVARPVFSWSVGQGDATYELVLDGDVVASSTGLGSFTPPADLTLGTHSWFVRATDDPGNIARSVTRNFKFAKPGKLKILGVKPFAGRGGGAIIKTRISDAGRVTAKSKNRRGKLIAKGTKKRGSAGIIKVRIKPTRKGRKLFGSKKKLKAKLKVTFHPASGGKAAKAKRKVTVHR
ncbi:MAG: S8 family serine peptidase [Thermoleophilia bacterium]|nr:S8 family serine peptidase [Thermoleophilia bacterium]